MTKIYFFDTSTEHCSWWLQISYDAKPLDLEDFTNYFINGSLVSELRNNNYKHFFIVHAGERSFFGDAVLT